MPYVSSSRFTGSRVSTGVVTSGSNAGKGQRSDAATAYEFTYSFRTGRGLALQDNGQSSKLDPESEVYKPTGNLVDQLAYRKRFIERQITHISTRPGAPTHFLLGDVGHEFGSFKVKSKSTDNAMISGSSTVKYSSTNVRPSYLYVLNQDGSSHSTSGMLDAFSSYFSSKGAPVFILPGSTYGPGMVQVRAEAGKQISLLNPFATKASILASLTELARGDIPGILTNLRRHMVTITDMKRAGIRDAASALGSEYLNNVFGWAPIMRDINAAIKILLTLDSALFPEDDTRRQVRRIISTRGSSFQRTITMEHGSQLVGSGTWIYQKGFYNKPIEPIGSGIAFGTLPGNFVADVSVLENLSLQTTARFNTGARPSLTNNQHLDRIIDLAGLELTPEVIWELTPWSWLIDWFLSIGTVLGNLSTLGVSNTILNYAYSTVRLETKGSIWAKPQIITSGTGVYSTSGNFLTSYEIDHKVRIAASPFGFGMSAGSLSASQWAILGALGLSRSRA